MGETRDCRTRYRRWTLKLKTLWNPTTGIRKVAILIKQGVLFKWIVRWLHLGRDPLSLRVSSSGQTSISPSTQIWGHQPLGSQWAKRKKRWSLWATEFLRTVLHLPATQIATLNK